MIYTIRRVCAEEFYRDLNWFSFFLRWDIKAFTDAVNRPCKSHFFMFFVSPEMFPPTNGGSEYLSDGFWPQQEAGEVGGQIARATACTAAATICCPHFPSDTWGETKKVRFTSLRAARSPHKYTNRSKKASCGHLRTPAEKYIRMKWG